MESLYWKCLRLDIHVCIHHICLHERLPLAKILSASNWVVRVIIPTLYYALSFECCMPCRSCYITVVVSAALLGAVACCMSLTLLLLSLLLHLLLPGCVAVACLYVVPCWCCSSCW